MEALQTLQWSGDSPEQTCYKGNRVQTCAVCPRSVPNYPGGRMSTIHCNALYVTFSNAVYVTFCNVLYVLHLFHILTFAFCNSIYECAKECAQLPGGRMSTMHIIAIL